MNEMVERLKKVLHVALMDEGSPMISDEAADGIVRAAIAAMREPTDKMVDAGWPHTADPCWQEDVWDAWQAMIDAALEDK